MKKYMLIPSLFAILFLGASCKKSSPDNGSTGTPETPFATAVNDKSLVTVKAAYTQNTGGAETGYKLHFAKDGQVTKLGTELGTVGTYPVSFWNYATQQLLGTVTVNVTDTSNFFYAALATPINVTAGTEYVLSLHLSNEVTTTHWLYSNAGGTVLYPFTISDVVADGIQDIVNLPQNTTPTFPSAEYAIDQHYLYDCDLVYTPAN
jgi:Domain of unknown function (DUF4082)